MDDPNGKKICYSILNGGWAYLVGMRIKDHWFSDCKYSDKAVDVAFEWTNHMLIAACEAVESNLAPILQKCAWLNALYSESNMKYTRLLTIPKHGNEYLGLKEFEKRSLHLVQSKAIGRITWFMKIVRDRCVATARQIHDLIKETLTNLSNINWGKNNPSFDSSEKCAAFPFPTMVNMMVLNMQRSIELNAGPQTDRLDDI